MTPSTKIVCDPVVSENPSFDENSDAFLKFAQEIRKQTIEEILKLLKEVPNPEANRAAINRITSIL